MNFLLGLITKNPATLSWLMLSAFIAGGLAAGGTAWTIQGWRLDAVKAEFKGFKGKVKLLGEQAKKEAERIENEQAKTLKEIKDEVPKQIAAARNGAVAAYRLRYADSGGRGMSCPSISAVGTNEAGKEQVASEGPGTDPAFVQDSAQDAALIGLWQAWATKNKFPVE